jgi:hypothetical protein
MPDLLSQSSRGNAEHRALGMGDAVAAHPARDRPRQRPATASAHDQQVTTAAGEAYQDPACRAAFHMRLHHRIIRNFTPHCDERIPETLPGHLLPDLAQIARRTKPGPGAITLRRQPRDNGYQERIMGAGHNLRVAQRPQAARRATRPDDDAPCANGSILAAHRALLADKPEPYECLPTRLPGAPTYKLAPTEKTAKTAAVRGWLSRIAGTRCERQTAACTDLCTGPLGIGHGS